MEKLTLLMMLFTLMMTWFGYVESMIPVGSGCSQNQNSTVNNNNNNNSVYRANLRSLLESLARNVPLQEGFFYNANVGNNVSSADNRVYGIAWCRGDVSRDTCSQCLNMTINVPLEKCPEIKDLVVWYDSCSLRFKNESFFGDVWNRTSSASDDGSPLEDPSVFLQGYSMMESLVKNVSNAPLMSDSSVVDVGNGGQRYGLGQCSRDLSKSDCQNCLENLLTTYRPLVMNRTEWEMNGVSCGMWYVTREFIPSPIPSDSGTCLRYKGEMMLAFVAIICYVLLGIKINM